MGFLKIHPKLPPTCEVYMLLRHPARPDPAAATGKEAILSGKWNVVRVNFANGERRSLLRCPRCAVRAVHAAWSRGTGEAPLRPMDPYGFARQHGIHRQPISTPLLPHAMLQGTW